MYYSIHETPTCCKPEGSCCNFSMIAGVARGPRLSNSCSVIAGNGTWCRRYTSANTRAPTDVVILGGGGGLLLLLWGRWIVMILVRDDRSDGRLGYSIPSSSFRSTRHLVETCECANTFFANQGARARISANPQEGGRHVAMHINERHKIFMCARMTHENDSAPSMLLCIPVARQ